MIDDRSRKIRRAMVGTLIIAALLALAVLGLRAAARSDVVLVFPYD